MGYALSIRLHIFDLANGGVLVTLDQATSSTRAPNYQISCSLVGSYVHRKLKLSLLAVAEIKF